MNVKALIDLTLADGHIELGQEQNTDAGEHQTGQARLNPAQSTTVSFGTINSATGCYVESDQPVDITLNGVALPRLTPPFVNTKARFFYEGPVTALVITYPTGQTGIASVVHAVWGDGTA